MASSARTPRKRSRGTRRAREWLVRGALVALSLSLAFVSVRASLGWVVAPIDPARAYRLAPANGQITGRYAQQQFSSQITSDPQSTATTLAKRALLSDATAVDALTVLGFQAQLRGESANADALFRYSMALSRRELRPRIWAIESAVNRGDIAGALFNYDIALRSSREAGLLLFPSLGSALREPRIRALLMPILAGSSPWRDNFFVYIAAHGIAPEGLAALLAEGRTKGITASEPVQVQTIDALLLAKQPEEAWQLYRHLRGNVSRLASRNLALSLSATQQSAFDWRVGEDNRLGAAILNDAGRGIIDFVVPPQLGGVLASQTQLLPPGRYRLTGRSKGLAQPQSAQPYWAMVCSDNRELGRVAVPNSDIMGGQFEGAFTVPQNCPVQTLHLVARSSANIAGVSGQIIDVRLDSVR